MLTTLFRMEMLWCAVGKLPCHRIAVVLCVLFFFPLFICAQTSTTDWSIAVLNEILANVQPGQKTARIDDMEISVSTLKIWRDRLAGVPQPKSGLGDGIVTWPNGNVYYNFSNNVSAAKQKVFVDSAAEWSLFANLHFIPRTLQTNYITVYEDSSVSLGMSGTQQFIVLGTNGWSHYVICHEIGHALGLVHEQQRDDRDLYVTILTNNVQPGYGGLAKLTKTLNPTPYDFHSIMHYGAFTAPIDPAQPTMIPLPAYSRYAPVGQDDPNLSTYDRMGMAMIYGAGPALSAVVTNTQDSGLGSLRAALYYAYDHVGTTVSFNIPTNDPGYSNGVFNIQVTDQLPALINATTVDGTTQPGYIPGVPLIHLNGVLCNQASTFASGLRIRGTNCIVRGLEMENFQANGVRLDSGAQSNLVGGFTLGSRNVLSGNLRNGVAIFGTNPPGTWMVLTSACSGNVIAGNIIGLDASGTFSRPNLGQGVEVSNGARSNLIGGTITGARNIISGNSNSGILIANTGTGGNLIQGNYIGLNLSGTSAIGNGFAGIEIGDAPFQNYVGGAVPGSGNVISGNGNSGILIRFNALSNSVQGNFVGLDASGTVPLPNAASGVDIYGGAKGNLIGGYSPTARNIFSGNSGSGINIGDGIGNIVAGNYIGLNPSGSAALGNGFAGIDLISGSLSNTIGGSLPGAGNVISGNSNSGILIRLAGTDWNTVQGNIVGLNAAGTAALPNAGLGINIYGTARFNRIGGDTTTARNIISGNSGSGIFLANPNTRGNVVAGNFIGLNMAGTAAIPNGGNGVEIFDGSTSNIIGGTGSARNYISGSPNNGIAIHDAGTAANVVQGNTIGLNVSNNAALPNQSAGVAIWGGAISNIIGGVSFGAANLIASNGGNGIQFSDTTTSNNTARANSIYGNNGESIAFHNGGNRSAPAPALTSATMTTNITISGTLTSSPSSTFQIDFYSSPNAPAQGKTYLGAKSVTTTAGGSVSFSAVLAGHVPAGRIVTATATDPAGNTSGMSAGVTVTATSSVNDGIPNAWRAVYFGGSGATTNSQSCATCDPDGDGMNNRSEFLASTNPLNASSLLRLVPLPSNGSEDIASFLSATGIVYRLYGRETLKTNTWSILADQVIGTGGSIILNEPNLSETPQRYFRLEVLW